MKTALIQLKEAIHYYNISCGGEEYKFNASESIEELICDLLKQYGKQCAEQALKDAAENARIQALDSGGNKVGPTYISIAGIQAHQIDKQSILQTEIKTP